MNYFLTTAFGGRKNFYRNGIFVMPNSPTSIWYQFCWFIAMTLESLEWFDRLPQLKDLIPVVSWAARSILINTGGACQLFSTWHHELFLITQFIAPAILQLEWWQLNLDWRRRLGIRGHAGAAGQCHLFLFTQTSVILIGGLREIYFFASWVLFHHLQSNFVTLLSPSELRDIPR